jgi:hypothetical protein
MHMGKLYRSYPATDPEHGEWADNRLPFGRFDPPAEQLQGGRVLHKEQSKRRLPLRPFPAARLNANSTITSPSPTFGARRIGLSSSCSCSS